MKPRGSKNREVRGKLITYPTHGFQNDVARLLEKFVATKSIRFDEFTKVWRESNFSLVHMGRSGMRETREFMEECFRILLKYLLPPFNLQVRVGALYIIYSMYYTQRFKVKRRRITLPLTCWPNFCELRREVTEGQHLDAAYIIHKLISDRVFMLCAYPSHLSVDEVYLQENGQKRTGDTSIDQSYGLSEASGLLAQIQDEDNLCQLHAVHEKYHQLKCEFNTSRGGSADSPGSSLDLIKPDITEAVLDIIDPNRSKTSTDVIKKKTDTESKSDGSSSERALQIKSLKERAQSSKVDPTPSTISKRNSSKKIATINAEGWVIRKRGRPHSMSSKITPKPTAVSATSGDSSDTDSSTDLALPKRSRKSAPRKIISYDSEDEYEPERPVTISIKRNQSARRRSNNNQSNYNEEDDDDDESNSRKQASPTNVVHSSNKDVVGTGITTDKQDELEPGTFVGIRPSSQNSRMPVIGKVVKVGKLDSIEVIYYDGDFDTTWEPITAMKKDDTEGKPLVQNVNRSNIIMRNVTLTKTNKLNATSKIALKTAMKLI